MITSYRSQHPNHAHQLAICVSKHLYATKDGRLKYQQKPIEVRLETLSRQDRAHLVIYTLRDHCSGLFYAEVGFGPDVVPAAAFLKRAWSPKSHYAFCGLPRLLLIPKTVQSVFPELPAQVAALGIRLGEVTSGFQSGVRDIRTIEDQLGCYRDLAREGVDAEVQRICLYQANTKSRNGVDSKLALWHKHVPGLQYPPEDWSNNM